MKKIVLFMLLVSAQLGCTQTQVESEAPGDSGLRLFLSQWEEAQARFINGDPTSWKQNASQGHDATIFGAFGGYEKGWSDAGPRYDWASSQFKESKATQKIEYLNTAVSGDLAFTVAIERQQVRLGGQEDQSPRALRVTQIFRKEGDGWKLLHRHADALTERQAPSTGPQK